MMSVYKCGGVEVVWLRETRGGGGGGGGWDELEEEEEEEDGMNRQTHVIRGSIYLTPTHKLIIL